MIPSDLPSGLPSIQPSSVPTNQPSAQPISFPSSVPSYQPISVPSQQPISSPSSPPSDQPTMVPRAPLGTFQRTKGVINYLVQETYSSDTSDVLGTSYVLFGKNYRNNNKRFPFEITLQSTHSLGFVSPLEETQGGIRNDVSTRSTTVIGDINGDTFTDLLVGYPMESKCELFVGRSDGHLLPTPSITIQGDVNHGGGQLGWASAGITDLTHDGSDEILVSAVYANVVYIIYGGTKFKNENAILNLHELGTQDVCKIIGSTSDSFFGIALALVHDFDNDGTKDIAISSIRTLDGRGIVNILFGSVGLGNGGILSLDSLLTTHSKHVLKIIGLPNTYTGLSIAGIGDINRDNYDDLAIGSFSRITGEQSAYIICGNNNYEEDQTNELDLFKMSEDDGFVVKGAGFLVSAAGDVNDDRIPDVMITHFSEWSSYGHAYLIDFPENITYVPTLQPSSSPTTPQTSHSPSNLPSSSPSFSPSSSSFSPTSRNSSSPSITRSAIPSTIKPSFLPSLSPSPRPTSAQPTVRSSAKPTVVGKVVKTLSPITHSPLLSPTQSPTSLGGLRGDHPSFLPTIQSTLSNHNNNSSDFTTIICPSFGRYAGNEKTNNRFIVTAESGKVHITGNNEHSNAINIYSLHCSGDYLDVILHNFRSSTDRFDLSKLSEFYSYQSLPSLTYSYYRGSLTLFLCYDSLKVTLHSHSNFDVEERNFIFTESAPKRNRMTEEKIMKEKARDVMTTVFVGFVILIVCCVVCIDLCCSVRQNKDKKEEVKDKESKEDDQGEELEPVLQYFAQSQPTDRNNRWSSISNQEESSESHSSSFPSSFAGSGQSFISFRSFHEELLTSSSSSSVHDNSNNSSNNNSRNNSDNNRSYYHHSSNTSSNTHSNNSSYHENNNSDDNNNSFYKSNSNSKSSSHNKSRSTNSSKSSRSSSSYRNNNNSNNSNSSSKSSRSNDRSSSRSSHSSADTHNSSSAHDTQSSDSDEPESKPLHQNHKTVETELHHIPVRVNRLRWSRQNHPRAQKDVKKNVLQKINNRDRPVDLLKNIPRARNTFNNSSSRFSVINPSRRQPRTVVSDVHDIETGNF
jgi:hypothetical protein